MFNKIENHHALYGLLRGKCKENGVCVVFCKYLLDANNELDETKVKVLQVDDYYNTKHLVNPPPSIDCFIIVKEGGVNNYSFYLVELRNVSGAALVRPREILRKFETTFLKFIGTEFSDVFISDDVNVTNLEAWLVTDPYGLGNLQLTEEQYRNKIKGTVLDQYNLTKPFQLKGKVCMVRPVLPHPQVCLSNIP